MVQEPTQGREQVDSHGTGENRMHKEKPANKDGGQNRSKEATTNNLPRQQHGYKASFASADFYDPLKEAIYVMEKYLLEQGEPEECFAKRTGNGLLVALDNRREFMHPISADSPDTNVPGQLLPAMLQDYSFDPLSAVAVEKPLYEGFLSPGDLAIWLGREKHRKSKSNPSILYISGIRP